MTLFIGGRHHGQFLSKDESDLKLESISKQYGPRTGMQSKQSHTLEPK